MLGQTAMPTQDGGGKGKVSLSGGWTWAIPAKSKSPDAAWDFIKTLQTQQNAAKYATNGAQIAVRKDVASDAGYKESSKSTQFFTDLVSVTVYRPGAAGVPEGLERDHHRDGVGDDRAVHAGQGGEELRRSGRRDRRQGQDDHKSVTLVPRRNPPL